MARRVVGTVFQSLDGVMQAPGGPREDPSNGFELGGWQFGLGDEEAGEWVGDSLQPPYALLLGRRTYDIFASFWPFVEGDEAALGEAFTRADKYVLTNSDAPLEWANSTSLAGFDALAEIMRGNGPHLQIWGSSTLYPGLLERGLLDRLTLLTYPLLLGSGKRLFGEGTPPGTMRVSESRISKMGTVLQVMEPVGHVETGKMLAPPNAREDERQRKIEGGTW